ncbi:MAG: sugar ABC transporter ATP-binding protein [Acidobacteria bacterium]|nr:MAG: sugar ABC transporter ATP-binding protein [Acidobacteriota bacterium]
MPAAMLLRAESLDKTYTTPALVDVSLELRGGEVHALVGENGAGKSTLARILVGLTRPDAGRMLLAGDPYGPSGKAEAARRGVAIVPQELNLVESLTVAEQVLFGAWPSRRGFVDRRALRVQAHAALGRVGLRGIDPERPVRSLGVGQRQMLAMAAALARPCRVLILDEPTAALSEHEAERLFAQMERLKAEGAAILYVSHRLEEVRRLADRVTVLRDGRVVAARERGETTSAELVQLMVGRDTGSRPPRDARPAPTGEPLLRIRGLRRGRVLRDVSFELWRGEILGLAGLMGSGRTETVRALFGADRVEGGEIELRGRRLPRLFLSPKQAVAHGIALVTENRKDEGLLLPLSIRANLTLPRLSELCRRGFVRREAERAAAGALASRLGVKCASLEQPVRELSGGNQQKVVLGREIHAHLRELAGAGKAVLVVSSEIEELRALCDRIVVLSGGSVAATFTRERFDQDAILVAALRDHAGGNGAG